MAEHDQEALRLFESGFTYEQVARELGISYKAADHAIARARRENKHIEDTGLPTVDDDGYTVPDGDREVYVSKERLKDIKRLYCGEPHLTGKQVCREVGITERDFNAIRRAFGITHDDAPFLDEEMESRSVDDLISDTLENRKQQYFLKLQEQEVASLQREVEKYRQRDYLTDKIHGIVTEHMQSFGRGYSGPVSPPARQMSGLMLEVPIVDLHLGKLAWAPETGENYDYKIATDRFEFVIGDIISRVQDREFERVLFPIGQDFFNYDTLMGETASGTRQDNDLRWQKLFSVGVEVLVRAIDALTMIAPVEVLAIPGNHDLMTSFYAIQYLDAWYRGSERVRVNPDPRSRKYIEFGECLIGYSHGDKEKKRIFGNMQVEAAEAWGRTKFREWHCGHFHSEQVQEEHGVIVRRLSSMTGTDSWHYTSGYVGAIVKNQSFVWDKRRGLQEIILTNLVGDIGSRRDLHLSI